MAFHRDHDRFRSKDQLGIDGQIIRVRTPRKGEILGTVLELHGGSRMSVSCQDGFPRMCRIPGKVRKKLWIRVGDVVAIVPWTVETNEKADISYRYTTMQAEMLRRQGFLKM